MQVYDDAVDTPLRRVTLQPHHVLVTIGEVHMGKHGVLKDRVAAFPCEDVFENDSPHFIDPEDHAVDAVRYKRTTARQRGRLVILR